MQGGKKKKRERYVRGGQIISYTVLCQNGNRSLSQSFSGNRNVQTRAHLYEEK